MYNDVKLNDAVLTTDDKAHVDKEIASLEILQRKVNDRLTKLKSHRNSLSVTYRIPAEVLGEIMLTAVASYAEEYKAYVQSQQPDWADATSIFNNIEDGLKPIATGLPFPLVLSQVSYSWRNLAQGLQPLWSTISIALSKARYSVHLELLKEWLKRAKTSDLDIILTIRDESRELIYWTDYPPIEILELLASVKHQWSSLQTTLPDIRWQEIIEGVGYQSLERLETLCLYRSGNPAHDRRHHTERLPFHFANHDNADDGSAFDILENTPSLRSIILPDSIKTSQLPIDYDQITHIELHTISLDDCLSLLRDSPNLVGFVFFGIYHMPPESGPHGWMGALGVGGGVGAGVNLGAFGIPGPTPSNNTNTKPESEREDKLMMKDLTSFSVFSDPSILARLFDRLVTPKLDNVHFKSTTVARLSIGLTSLRKLLLRSRSSSTSSTSFNDYPTPASPSLSDSGPASPGPSFSTLSTSTSTYNITSNIASTSTFQSTKSKKKKKKTQNSNSFNEPSTLRILHLSIPNLGKCEALLKDWLREWQSTNIESLKLESWQHEGGGGFNELFWRDLYIPYYLSGVKGIGERKMMLPKLKKLVYIGAVNGFKLRSVMEFLMARVIISRQDQSDSDSNRDLSSNVSGSKSSTLMSMSKTRGNNKKSNLNSNTGSTSNAGKGKSKDATGTGTGTGSTSNNTKGKKPKYGNGLGYNHLGHTDYSWIDEFEKSLLEDDEDVGEGPEDPDWDFEALQGLAKFESLEVYDGYSDFKKELQGDVDVMALMFRTYIVGLVKDAGFKLKIITSEEYIH